MTFCVFELYIKGVILFVCCTCIYMWLLYLNSMFLRFIYVEYTFRMFFFLALEYSIGMKQVYNICLSFFLLVDVWGGLQVLLICFLLFFAILNVTVTNVLLLG